MAVSVKPSGNGDWVGAPHNIKQFSLTEESTPLAGGDESGSIGGGSFSVVSNRDTVLLMDDPLTFTEGEFGDVPVRVMGVQDSGVTAQIEVDHATTKLMSEKSLPPYNGTVGGWLRGAFTLCGLPEPTIASTISTRSVAYGAHVGVVWDAIKQVCAAQQIEMLYTATGCEFRLIRERNLELFRVEDPPQHNVGGGEMARAVEVVSYSNVWGNGSLVYPTGGWNEEVRVFQVAAGETLEVDVEVEVSVVSVVQPTPVVWVSREHNASSVYSISGNDGLPIQPAQWIAEGGKLEVTINPDYKSLHLKITGSGNENLGPYQLAMASGTSDAYSSIRIVGSGVWQRPVTELYLTGVSDSDTATEIGETIELPFAYGRDQVLGLGISAAQRFTGIEQSLSAEAEYFPLEGQVPRFGTTAGARFSYVDHVWRVRSATVAETNQSIDAETDTTFSDFNTTHAGKTFGEFNTGFSTFTFREFDLMPLRGN